jgi:DNA polymerase III delta prime subunit
MNKNVDNKTDLWLEKYRPTSFKNYIGNKEDIEKIISWIENYDTRKEKFLLLYGAPGVGKTTLAHLILNKYKYELIEINTSDCRSKKMIKQRIGILSGGVSVVSSMDNTIANNKSKSILKRKLVKRGLNIKFKKIGLLMDEIDGISINGESSGIQELMDIIIGKKKKRFNNKFPIICTCNSIKNKKIQTLLKFSLVIKLTNPSKEELTLLCNKIVKKENIKLNIQLLTVIIENSFDYRELINNLYQIHIYSHNHKINISNIYNIIKYDNNTNQTSCDNNNSIINNQNDISNLSYNKELSNINTIYNKLKFIMDNDTIHINQIKYFINKDYTILFISLFSNYIKLLKNYKLTKTDNYNIIKIYLNNYVIGDKLNYQIYRNQLWELQNYINNTSLLSNILLLKLNHHFFDNSKKKKKINKSYTLEHHSSFNKVLQDTYLSKTKKEDINNMLFINDIESIYYINSIMGNDIIDDKKSSSYKKSINNNVNVTKICEKMNKISKKIDEYFTN